MGNTLPTNIFGKYEKPMTSKKFLQENNVNFCADRKIAYSDILESDEKDEKLATSYIDFLSNSYFMLNKSLIINDTVTQIVYKIPSDKGDFIRNINICGDSLMITNNIYSVTFYIQNRNNGKKKRIFKSNKHLINGAGGVDLYKIEQNYFTDEFLPLLKLDETVFIEIIANQIALQEFLNDNIHVQGEYIYLSNKLRKEVESKPFGLVKYDKLFEYGTIYSTYSEYLDLVNTPTIGEYLWDKLSPYYQYLVKNENKQTIVNKKLIPPEDDFYNKIDINFLNELNLPDKDMKEMMEEYNIIGGKLEV
jgi:hypothetical protein